jgi:hypothetical protein
MKRMNERQLKEQRIRDLTAELSSTASRVGDWAVIKCLEYKNAGKTAPYDLDDICEKRQAIRDEINQLQAEIEALDNEAE